MSETLFDKARYNYMTALMIYKNMDGDEVFLNHVAYNLQQAVELAIKFELEMNGISYPKTHDIEHLISVSEVNNIQLSINEYIEDHAEMLSAWEAKTRYILDYRVQLKKIEKALPQVNEYLSDIERVYFQEQDEEQMIYEEQE